MKQSNIRIGLACVLVLGLTAGYAAAQGSLTPPGVPLPTMHTLEEIYQNQTTLAANQAALDARLDTIEQQTASPVPAGMVLIPAGDFTMGDTFGEGNDNELPLHTNTVSAFYMDETETTKAKWDGVYTWAVANGYTFDNAGSDKAADHPVHTVNWYDCVKWANARSEKEGLTACYLAETTTGTVYRTGVFAPSCDWYANGYRLPTEAEWEKAARGGAANRRFPWSATSSISHSRANYSAVGGESYDQSPPAGYHPDTATPNPRTLPVGSFAANGYGLYDMEGNLFEWCWDWYDGVYYGSSPETDPHGPGSGSNRVLRGGCWDYRASICRVAFRYFGSPDFDGNLVGFRLVRVAQ